MPPHFVLDAGARVVRALSLRYREDFPIRVRVRAATSPVALFPEPIQAGPPDPAVA